ncbi:outer membrane beta-barrel protein [Acinetobacter gerneri]|uniref:Outer membrane beta-barrel protein n=1 Tax=Acinetobacter gerneri TaxID=202952 RepID=A0AAW8JGZ8_9GAMM|nr:outer membrane beta-barrel protein [Acinetobacter gerneri]MDQ9008690.1 outer membrane beta-barrel protein [Acinetobacter gerneri]MDQ9012762.1 outer membrane beta-barrel protein [Acinetobacter gerneri]MDQ9024229.1 outer membrane beta-barrel protein [Acinetobacter gerneri]MDQ9051466.1 outer membrane beta-barrel protein [Acinetobacter gerneri]MDQ9058689.1 outer membrane beta-barrel protein [Acinetobacter gerneri]
MNKITLKRAIAVSQFVVFTSMCHAEQPAQGWLFKDLNQNDYGITVSGWAQASVADSNHGNQLTPATVFRRESGFTLDQMGIMIEKKVKSNLISRVGPIPVEKSDSFDWGFNITAMYGADNFFFRTYGLDDDWGGNKVGNFGNTDYYSTLTQAYVELYFPYLGGSNLMLGLFHTPLANEIGFALPSPAPTDFYTHTYSFIHGPAKHAGALWSSYIFNQPNSAKLSYELGLAKGYNSLQDINNNWDVIGNLRWRSADFKTWIDFENIYGNSADDSVSDCACGSPIPSSSTLAHDNSLKRYQSYLTLTHHLDEKNTLIAEASYGHQEKSLLADVFNQIPYGSPKTGGKNASWSGIDLSYLHKFNPKVSAAIRGEYFDTDGVHVLLPFSGSYRALTSNISWQPVPYLRLRPEIRYDWYSGHAKPYGADGNYAPPLIHGRYDDQFSYSLDATFFF